MPPVRVGNKPLSTFSEYNGLTTTDLGSPIKGGRESASRQEAR